MPTTTRLASVVLLLVVATGCSEINLNPHGNDVDPGSCPLDVPLPGAVEVDEDCGVIPDVADPWNVVEKWRYWGAGDNLENNSSYAPPLVGRLVDTDTDGDIDADDHPIIALVAYPADLSTDREGVLQLIDGVTREELWNVPEIYYGTGHAIGDASGDGRSDVVVFDAGKRVSLYDGAGNRLWRTTESAVGMFPQATIADLDADGIPEVIADNLILAGPTGEIIGHLTVRSNIPYTMPAVGDIDLDGKQEILYGNTLHRWDGTPYWTTNLAGDYGHFSAILNADEDPYGEFIMVGGYTYRLFDTDGTQLASWDLPRRAASAPCIADFDGDGGSEIAFGLTNGGPSPLPAVFQVRELGGALLWQRDVTDKSGIAGCSAYDIDGDAAYEILYADETQVHIFDGDTGEVRWSTIEHFSGTVYEYPVIADIDQDGSAEMLVVNSNTDAMPLLQVFGHATNNWAASGETWSIHDYAVTNITPEGVIPQAPPLYWVEHNTYRARPLIQANPIDFQVEIVDVCSASCQDDSIVRVGVQVWNAGALLVPSGTMITLWSSTPGGATALDTQELPAMLPGRVTNVTYEVPLSDIGSGELVVRADDIGTGAGFWSECDEANNTVVWGAVECGSR